jgi:hypothetical protein
MQKDRLTLLLGGYTVGDCKIKPFLFFHIIHFVQWDAFSFRKPAPAA